VRIVGVGSVRGAPGVTTSALLLASALPEPTVLLEADLHGGVLAVRYGLGREPGLTTLAAAGTLTGDGWREHAQEAGGVAVIVGPDSPDRARSVWRSAGQRISRVLGACEASCVVDLGRIEDDVPLTSDMAMLIVLIRPVAEQLVTLSHRLPALRRHAGHVGVVLVGDGEYRPADVAEAIEVDVLGALPHDPRATEALAGRGGVSSVNRSQLSRAIVAVAGSIDAALGPAHVVPEPVS